MIEIRFEKQGLTFGEKEKYARALKRVIRQISLFNAGVRLVKDVVGTEVKIIFKQEV